MIASPKYIRWFAETGIGDVPLVGGKNASLGEMYRELRDSGVKVPNGFAVTADGYRHFLKCTGLDRSIAEILAGLDTRELDNLPLRGRRLREAVLAAQLPSDLEAEIIAAYVELGGVGCKGLDVAVRSSATAEDLPNASFAGQQESI